MASALADHIGIRPPTVLHLWSPRLERTLGSSEQVGSAGLVHGDRLVLVPEARSRGHRPPIDGSVELVVCGGLAAGRRYVVGPGEFLVGRSPEATITVDDPLMSREHFWLRIGDNDTVSVVDAGSLNQTLVNGRPLPSETVIKPGDLVGAGRSLFRLEQCHSEERRDDGELGIVHFNRVPRIARRTVPVERKAPVPPDERGKRRFMLATSLAPLAAGVVLYYMTKSPYTLILVALAPIMAVLSFFEDRIGARGEHRRRLRKFAQELDDFEHELVGAIDDERAALRQGLPDPGEIAAWVRWLEPRLWERRPHDADFMELRIGIADVPSPVKVERPDTGSDAGRAQVVEVLDRHSVLGMAPVSVRLNEAGSMAVVGEAREREAIARWLALQSCALQSPKELTVSAAVFDGSACSWEWLRWLPHSQADQSALPTSLIAQDRSEGEHLLEAIRVLLKRRASDAPPSGEARVPFVLVLVEDSAGLPSALLDDVIRESRGRGVGVVWLGEDGRRVPGECGAIIRVEGDGRGSLALARAGTVTTGITLDGIDESFADEVALRLAPVRDFTESDSAGIPRGVGLLELLGLEEVGSEDVIRRWQENGDHRGAPIGMGRGQRFVLDLRRDGPHGLIGGTTGAGKSYLLQTLVASLAATHPPDRLGFVLVDYKGGAAFKECAELPHVVGFVSNLDERLAQRALASLRAELGRRMELFAEAGVAELVQFERKEPDRAPPMLVVIIDEFATLQTEVLKDMPEFTDEVVKVAQQGRSLGVHLLLATQRPSGAVTRDVDVNTDLRIALRVSDEGESDSIIGAKDAARIPRDLPGRAYAAKRGEDRLTEFQSGDPGRRRVVQSGDRREAIMVRDLYGPASSRPEAAGEEASETELVRVVRAAREAASDLGIPSQHPVWLEPLPEFLPLSGLGQDGRGEATTVVGLLDDPEHQAQRPLTIDWSSIGTILVFGGPGSGKSTTLVTIALAAARRLPPEALHVYGLDFSAGRLEPLEPVPHVGSIVRGDDGERVDRLLRRIEAEVDERKSLPRSELESRPSILVLLNDYAGFMATYDSVALGGLVDLVPRLVAEGRAVNVNFAISSDRRGPVPASIAGVVDTRIVLRMASDDEFMNAGVHWRVAKGMKSAPPGRGLLDGTVEVQVAQPDEAVFAELRGRYPDAKVPVIGSLPLEVSLSELPQSADPLEAALGVGGDAVEPLVVRRRDGHFVVSGPYRSGRSTALGTIAGSLVGAGDWDLHLFAPRPSPLIDLPCWTATHRGVDACIEAAAALVAEMQAQAPQAPVGIVIDDAEELIQHPAAGPFEELARRGRDLPLWIVCSVERQAARRAFTGFLIELRKDEHGLLLMPGADDGELFGIRLPRWVPFSLTPGRGYVVVRGALASIQVARDERLPS